MCVRVCSCEFKSLMYMRGAFKNHVYAFANYVLCLTVSKRTHAKHVETCQPYAAPEV